MPITSSPLHGDICIEAKHVFFRYGDAVVLEDISFAIPAGDFVGVIGPNGGGKTTLLKIILGLLEPTSGEITIYGHSVAKAKEHFEVGYVPQHISHVEFAFPATVEEVVKSGRTARRGIMQTWTPADAAVVEEMLAFTGVAEFRHALIGELSGGQRQRVFIARALAGLPKILILDEPTVGVDAASIRQFNTLLGQLHRQEKMTIIMVSHDVDAVTQHAQRVLTVNRRII